MSMKGRFKVKDSDVFKTVKENNRTKFLVGLLLYFWPLWLSRMHIRLVIRRLQVRSPSGLATFFNEIFSMVSLSLPLFQEG